MASQAELEAERDYLIKHWPLKAARVMPDGRIFGIHAFIYTYGLLEDVQRWGYGNRWCYSCPWEALTAMMRWDGAKEPPGPWLRGKGLGLDRWNELVYRKGPNGLFELIPVAERDWLKIWRVGETAELPMGASNE